MAQLGEFFFQRFGYGCSSTTGNAGILPAANPPWTPWASADPKVVQLLGKANQALERRRRLEPLVINGGDVFTAPIKWPKINEELGVVSPFFKRIFFTPVITGRGFSPPPCEMLPSRERSRIALEGKSRQVPCLGWFKKGMSKLFRVEFDLNFINLDATLKPLRNPADFSLWRSSEMLQPAVVFYIYIPTFDTTWSPTLSSFLFFGNEHKVPTYRWLYNIRSSALQVYNRKLHPFYVQSYIY